MLAHAGPSRAVALSPTWVWPVSLEGVAVARIGLGCAGLTAPGLEGERLAHAVIERAWESGIRSFDVAPLYGGGLAEERLGAALAGLPRAQYSISSKTGVTRPYGQGPVPVGSTVFRAADVWDFGFDATLRSVETSLHRLRTDRLDLVHLHDVEGREAEALTGACRALRSLRVQGTVGGIGVGSNGTRAPALLMGQGAIDAMLIAGRYTLLDTSAAPLFKLARRAGLRVIAAGLLNSGVLARGITPGATFDYRPPSAQVAGQVLSLQQACSTCSVPLMAAALQFAMRCPYLDGVLLGPRNPSELDELLRAMETPIPAALWRELPRPTE